MIGQAHDGLVRQCMLLLSLPFLSHALRISFGQFCVSSRRVRIESGRAKGIPQEGRISTLVTYKRSSPRSTLLSGALSTTLSRGGTIASSATDLVPSHTLQYPDKRCLASFLHEMTHHHNTSLRLQQRAMPPEPHATQQTITDFYQSQDPPSQPSKWRGRE